ncbi:MAG: NTP transferase domain-containing protein [Rhodothermales bacterium]
MSTLLHLTAIVPAAGHSSRMGTANKLLLPLGDKTILEHVAAAICAAPVEDVVVVTGHQHEQVKAALAGYPVRFAHNARHADGMASSLACGVLAASSATDGFLICLGDMPFLSSRTITRLRDTFANTPRPAILIATADGRRGHPVLFDSAYRNALLHLRGDVGARAVIQAHAEAVVEVETGNEALFQDVDTQEAYDQIRRGTEHG